MVKKSSNEKFIDGPADAIAAENLGTALRAFNAGAGDRSMLTGEDVRRLDEIGQLANEFVAAEPQAKGYLRGEMMGGDFAAAVARYRAKTTGAVNLIVEGETIVAPAIESGAVRRHLVDEGNAIVAALETYAENAKAREAEKRQDFADQIAALEEAMSFPESAGAINAWDALVSSTSINTECDYFLNHVDPLRDTIQMALTLLREKGLVRHRLRVHDRRDLAKVIAAWRRLSSQRVA